MTLQDEFSPEEQAAIEAMEADTGEDFDAPAEPNEAETTNEAPEAAEDTAAPEGGTPETPEQQEQELTREREGEPAAPPPGYVPHQALHAEREARRKLAQELEQIKATIQQQQNPPEAAPQYVDPLENPEGFRKWAEYNQQQSAKQAEEIARQQQEQAQRAQQMQAIQQAEQEFTAKTPDYQDAVTHMRDTRANELRMQGYDDQQIAAQISQDVQGIVQAAQQLNMNPAELAYYRATQMGYKTKAQQQAASQQEAVAKETQRMQAQNKAQASTQNLGSGAGEQQSGGLTAEALANMSEAEFAKLSDDQIRKAMGG